jgi:hypothetical protein
LGVLAMRAAPEGVGSTDEGLATNEEGSFIMVAQNVIQLKPAQKTPHRRSIRVSRAIRRQSLAAAGIGLVACTVTALSLHHLADGIMLVTKAPAWEAWSEGTGIDLGFISMELATIAATTDKLRKQISRYTRPAIAGTLAGSAVMNGLAFGLQADGYFMMGAGALLGAAIPALVYCLTRIGATLYSDLDARAA